MVIMPTDNLYMGVINKTLGELQRENDALRAEVEKLTVYNKSKFVNRREKRIFYMEKDFSKSYSHFIYFLFKRLTLKRIYHVKN